MPSKIAQMRWAQDLQGQLQCMIKDGKCAVMGGALVDWLIFSRSAKDVDIFVANIEGVDWRGLLQDVIGLYEVERLDNTMYEGGINSVWQGYHEEDEDEEFPIQIVVMQDRWGTYEEWRDRVMARFPLTVTRRALRFGESRYVAPEAERARDNRTLEFDWTQQREIKHEYIERQLRKFEGQGWTVDMDYAAAHLPPRRYEPSAGIVTGGFTTTAVPPPPRPVTAFDDFVRQGNEPEF